MQNLKAKLSNTENECSNLKTQNLNLQKENDLLSSSITNEDLAMIPKKPPSKGSMGSESPERFEMIDKKSDSIIMLEDNISNNSFNTNEWTNLCINENKDCEFPKDAKNVADLSMYW